MPTRPIDALAVARAALREPDLPTARLDGPAREVKLLVDARAVLVAQRTAACSRLRWFLHEIDSELDVPSRGLRRACVVRDVTARLAAEPGLVASLPRDVLARIADLNEQINHLEREVRDRVRVLAPTLLDLPGCGVLSAGVLLGEAADVTRFRSKDAFARFAGTAPIPVWSGDVVRVRLNRCGNRTTNCALHMIAFTQARGCGPGQAYVDKHLARGKTRKEALRLLRRRLSDRVYAAALRIDAPPPVRPTPPEPDTVLAA